MLKPLHPSEWTLYQAAHLLNRAGFGGTPEGIVALYRLGFERAVDKLVSGEEDADLFPLPAVTQAAELVTRQTAIRAAASEVEGRELRTIARKQDYSELKGMRIWWMNRMRYTLHPLREKMTLFWHGHFATSVEKVRQPLLILQQNETLRAGSLGNFRELTKEVSRDPAMMRYLDTTNNAKEKPNENFARELMELFTLGEGVRYSEKDIQECARAFTGYRIQPKTQRFTFARRRFDDSEKQFLGHRGAFDGDEVIDIITAQPESSEFIARKLWVFLAYDNPSDELVKELGRGFYKSGYNIASLLRIIFTSKEFYSSRAKRSQVKSPIQWIVQTSRMLDMSLPAPTVVESALVQMGQVPFAPPNVRGWVGGRTWISSSTLLYRYNLASLMVGNSSQGGAGKSSLSLEKIVPRDLRGNPEKIYDSVTFRLFNAALPQKERTRFIQFLQNQKNMSSDSTLRDFLHLMMSTPEYQLT